MVLGLDVSTSTVGYSILDNNGKLQNIGYINIGKFDNIFEKASFIEYYLNKILMINTFGIKKIYIEDISKKFNDKFSTAHTITLLARFNGIISYILYDLMGLMPEFISASSARKLSYGRAFIRGVNTKEFVFREFSKLENNINWIKDKKGRIKKEAYDAVDAFTLAKSGLLIGK